MTRGIETAFIGIVARDLELKRSRNDKSYTTLNVGIATGNLTDDGKQETQWVRVACFGEVAERIAATVTKGDKVYCEGSMRLERWTTHDGLARADLNCAAWKVEPLGKIGRNKPKRQIDPQAPLEREPAPFNDPLDF